MNSLPESSKKQEQGQCPVQPLPVHRGKGTVTYHTKHSGEWKNIGAVQSRRSIPRELLDQMQTDGFHVINCVRGIRRRGTDISHLTCCFADLDKDDLTASDLATADVPAPTITMFSGRGWWLYWVLDNGNGMPVYAKSERNPRYKWDNRETWLNIQSGLADRLAKFGSDRASMNDIARTCRLPGSINSKTGQQVSILSNTGAMYGIRELSAIVKPPRPSRPRTGNRAVSQSGAHERRQSITPKRKSGHIARWEKVAKCIETLSELRGGLGQGCRHRAILFYAQALKTLGIRGVELRKRCGLLHQSMKQGGEPFDASEMQETVRAAKCCTGGAFNFGTSYQTLIANLSITDEEARLIGLKTLPTKTRAERIRDRRDAIREIWDLGDHPTLPSLTQRLNEAGHPCKQRTVERDVRALKLSDANTAKTVAVRRCGTGAMGKPKCETRQELLTHNNEESND